MTAVRAPSPARSPERLVQGVADAAKGALAALRAAVEFLDGRMLGRTYINFAANTRILHGLGRMPKGWWGVAPNAGAFVVEVSRDATALTLIASGTGLVYDKIWVW